MQNICCWYFWPVDRDPIAGITTNFLPHVGQPTLSAAPLGSGGQCATTTNKLIAIAALFSESAFGTRTSMLFHFKKIKNIFTSYQQI
jgi:hypothetical protein